MFEYLGGYFLPFPAARHVMKTLQIDDKGMEDWRIEFPINDWLAKHRKKDVLAGVLQHPSVRDPEQDDSGYGLLLATQFFQLVDDQYDVSFKEGEKEKRVKEWLVNEGGAKESDLEWMSVCDKHGITRGGFVPIENDISAAHTITELTPEQFKRWYEAGKPSIIEFLAAEGVQKRGA